MLASPSPTMSRFDDFPSLACLTLDRYMDIFIMDIFIMDIFFLPYMDIFIIILYTWIIIHDICIGIICSIPIIYVVYGSQWGRCLKFIQN